ncbi:FACT complex subunit [Perkinsus chesapeaki]|uniref:FACT complex subunit n=1 Tax=Perkinsus chesapeaki TaxID=330153 RepID=A0A7J6MZM7_PERCH|nr:FACT complex subunit [Perkinsus chesapeaki]
MDSQVDDDGGPVEPQGSAEVIDKVVRGLGADLNAETYLVKLPPWLAERVRCSAPGTEIGRSDPINVTGKEKCRFAATGCALQGKPSDFEIRTTGSTPDGLYLFGFGSDGMEQNDIEVIEGEDEPDVKRGSEVIVRKVTGNRHMMPMRMDAKYKALLKERLAASNNVDLKHRTEVDTRSADELLASQQVKMFQYAAYRGDIEGHSSDDGYSGEEGPSAKRMRSEGPGARRTLGFDASTLPLPDVLMRLLVVEDVGWTLQQMAKRLRDEGLTVNLTQLRRNLSDLCDYQRRPGDNQAKYYLKAEYKRGGTVRKAGRSAHGLFKANHEMLGWRNRQTGQTTQLNKEDIASVSWYKVSKECMLKILMKNGDIYKYDGFQDSNYETVKAFFKKHYGLELAKEKMSTKGWCWGETSWSGTELELKNSDQMAFEIQATDIAQVVPTGKNEVALEFHVDDTKDPDDESLVELRFFIPNEEYATKLKEELIQKSGAASGGGTTICQFLNIPIVLPRGHYDLDMFRSSFKLRGKSFDYTIKYMNVSRMFMLPKPDGVHVSFVLGLDQPVRQGNTAYSFLVMQYDKEREVEDLSINLDDEELAKCKLQKVVSGEKLYAVMGQLFKHVTGKNVVTPCQDFKASNSYNCVRCSHKANDGFLYPLKKSFLFVNKPVMWIRYDDVLAVEFSRADSGFTQTRYFDLKVYKKGEGQPHDFQQMDRSEYNALIDFIQKAGIRIRNLEGSGLGLGGKRAREDGASPDGSPDLGDDLPSEDESDDEDYEDDAGGDDESSGGSDEDEEDDEDADASISDKVLLREVSVRSGSGEETVFHREEVLRLGDHLVLSADHGVEWEIALESLKGLRRRSSDGSFNFVGGTQAYCPAKKGLRREVDTDFDTRSQASFPDSDRTLSPSENDRRKANSLSQNNSSLPPGLDDTLKSPSITHHHEESPSPVEPLLLTSGVVSSGAIFGGRDSLASSLASFGGGVMTAVREATPGGGMLRSSLGTVPYCPGTTYKDAIYHYSDDDDQDSNTRPYRDSVGATGMCTDSAPPTPVQDSCIEEDDPLEDSSSITPKGSTGLGAMVAETRRVVPQPPPAAAAPDDDIGLVCSVVDERVDPNDFPVNTDDELFHTGMTISTDTEEEEKGEEPPTSTKSAKTATAPRPKPKAKSKARAKGKARRKRSPQSTASKRSRRVKVEDTSDDDDGATSAAAYSGRSPVRKRRRQSTGSRDKGTVKEEPKIAICFSSECRPSTADTRRLSACGAKAVSSMNGEVVMFVADRIKRSAKLMSAICRGIPVVSSKYVLQCFDKGEIAQPYDDTDWLKDAAGESHWGFTLSRSIRLARNNGPVLKGYQIHCATKSTATKDFKETVAAAGATYLPSLPARIPDERKDWLLVIVENEETRGDLRLVRKLKLPCVYVKELVMAAATTQELQLAKYAVEI